jgi:DNA mismatch repair protein MutL
MRTINPLPKNLIAKIKAGEVVERPSSVVKELMENSLDAKAHYIHVYLEEGGIKKIVVKDDGIGMNPEDLLISYLPHTTSKISSEEDLFKIGSFGFRGEALASISAVSLMTIKSRQGGNESGNMIELKEGILENQSSVGMPIGTEIIVESLFISTPARRKFLKDPSTELRYIVDILTRFALAHTNVGFRLTHENKTILDLPVENSSEERIKNILGSGIGEVIIPVNHENRYGKIHGYITKPQASSRSRTHQHLFINSRTVHDGMINQAVIESYGNLLEPRAFPPYVLHIDLPFENVDVNIHPKKQEVGFAFPSEIKKLVEEGIKQALELHNLTYTELGESDEYHMDRATAGILRELVIPWNLKDIKNLSILQIKNLYLVTMTNNGLLIVDQHAAHERILFEQFKEAFTSSQENPTTYKLDKPVIFDLSPSESMELSEKLEIFQKLGFDIDTFGNNSFKLSAIPQVFKTRDLPKLIREVLHDLEQGNEKNLDRETERTLSFLACRTAIKAGDPLQEDERKRLVEKLLESKTLYTCPHGRPTHIELPIAHLDKLFKRS